MSRKKGKELGDKIGKGILSDALAASQPRINKWIAKQATKNVDVAYLNQGVNAMPKGNKPKTPAWKKASPNNPYNNAGPKVKASSRGPVGVRSDIKIEAESMRPSNANKAGMREFHRQIGMGKPGGVANPRANRAMSGMYDKNAQAKASASYKRLVNQSPKQFEMQGKYQFSMSRGRKGALGSEANAGVRSAKASKVAPTGVGQYAKYNRVVKAIGGKSPSMTALGKAASVAGSALSIVGKAGNIAMAAQAGYAVGTLINKHTNLSSKIVDVIAPTYDPGTYKRNASSGQAYKTKRKGK